MQFHCQNWEEECWNLPVGAAGSLQQVIIYCQCSKSLISLHGVSCLGLYHYPAVRLNYDHHL